MRTSLRNLLWLSLAASAAVYAQGPGGRAGRMGFGGPMGPQHTVTGAPYSGVEVVSTQQTLANGNTIQNEHRISVFRDSQGRVRTESTPIRRPGATATGQTPAKVISIQDPVAGVTRHFDDQNKIVMETSMRPGPGFRPNGRGPNPNGGARNGGAPGDRARTGRGPAGQPSTDPNVTTEKLGIQTVNGVSAEGTRITRTIPAGAMGNSAAMQTVHEVWTSLDLKVPVLVKTTDPRNGTTTRQLTNIVRSEPDATLFQTPAGYTVQHARPMMGRGPRGK